MLSSGSSRYTFISPISLAAIPAVGDTTVATINGVEYEGEWDGNSNYSKANLYERQLKKVAEGGSNEYYALSMIDGAAFFRVYKTENEPPTTDYTVTFALYREARRVTIPQDYVEGLSDLATDVETAQSTANSAKTAAETAQSTANSAKTAAETALSTANSAKTAAETARSTANSAKVPGFSSSDSTKSRWFYFYPIVENEGLTNLYIGPTGGSGLSIKCGLSSDKTPRLVFTPPVYQQQQADVCFGERDVDVFRAPNITGIGGIIMYSSTAGSTKKFKLTVDDSGALTATEVTT